MKRLWRWAVALTVVLSLLFLVAEQAGWLTERQVSDHFAQHELSRCAAGAWLFGLLAADLILPVPSSLALTAGGSALGWAWGAAVATLGMLTGSAVGYGLCHRFGRRAYVRLIREGESNRVQRFFHRYGAWAIVLGRPIPMLPEVLCCLAGMIRYPARRFFLLTLTGIIPFALFLSWAGDRGTRGQEPIWLALSVIIPAAGMAVARLGVLMAGRRSKRPSPLPEPPPLQGR